METPPIPKQSRVRVHRKLTMVSSTPVKQGRACPLSSLDHAMADHTVRMVYYYARADRADGPILEFDRIRMSLNELLCLYPILTGRLARDDHGNWQVRFTDAGVRVLRAKVGTTLDEWLRSADCDEERDLTVWDELPDDPHVWSPFRIQLNEFECGGIAIGLSFTHLLSDPTSATFFIDSWSESHRRQALSHPPFIHPEALRGRAPPFTSTKSASYYASKSISSSSSAADKTPTPTPTATATATATFSFSDEAVRQQLLSKIRPACPDATPFDLLAALFWTSISQLTNAPEVGDNYKECHALSICVDFRKRLHAPLPYGYFGNAVYFTRLQSEGGDLGRVADLIHRHVSGIQEGDVWSTIDWLESKKDDKGRFGEPFQMYGPELTCVNMEHLIGEQGPVMYASAFGDECKIIHVSYDVEDVGEGLIWVMPSPEGGMARRVKVLLPAELVAKLCVDDAITSLEPTFMISGGLSLGARH